MDAESIRQLLEKVAAGALTVEEAVDALTYLPYENLDFATVDHHRALRQGFPEVLLCQGKTPEQIEAIAAAHLRTGGTFLATRADETAYRAITRVAPDASYHPLARTVVFGQPPRQLASGTILIVSGGTGDLPVAEEARVTAGTFGSPVETLYDVGVAGIHRLLDRRPRLEAARVLVVVAGMEGALPSVVGGLVSRPIVAVPTSIGYGAGFQGLAPLLAMLNSCAAGIGVVNIDNGFGAGVLAHRINLLGEHCPSVEEMAEGHQELGTT
ncbi:MAG: nickel pincer cofactor biosynthesis protein LarB [Candidatus Methylomirabilales bacterium]